MVVQCGHGDITKQFRCVRTSADMVNTRAAKLKPGGISSPPSGELTRRSSWGIALFRAPKKGIAPQRI
jgi:hypothetical protein